MDGHELMKKLLLIPFLILLFAVQSDAWMPCVVAGGGVESAAATAYCTGSTTCTASTPGSCDMRCEDFEGSSSCYAAYDSNCRAAIDYLYVSAGDSLDFTTAHNGTFSCTDKGSNAVQLTSVAAAHLTGFRIYDSEDKTASNGEFYFNYVSMTLAESAGQTIFFISENDGNSIMNLILYNSAGNIKLRILDGGMTATFGSTTLSNATWYRIGWAVNQATDTVTIYLDGSQEAQATDWDTAGGIRKYNYGPVGSGEAYTNATAHVFQYDNIAIDADGLPGGCN